MADDNYIPGNLNVGGALVGASVASATASLTSAMFSGASSNRLEASKSIQRVRIEYNQADGAAITSKTLGCHICYGAATLVQLKGSIVGVIPGADTITVDVHRSTAGGAFATVMSATMQFTSADTIRVVKNSTAFSSTTLVAGDILKFVITASGSTAQGLVVTLEIDEHPS